MTQADRAALELLLRQFKDADKENPNCIGNVADDDAAIKLVNTWSVFPTDWVAARCRGEAPADPKQLWEWLWRGVRADVGLLALRSGLDPRVAASKYHVVRQHRIIFPDGTISKWAVQLQRSRIVTTIKAQQEKE